MRHDRRWVVLNPDGSVLTARDEHRMLGVTATVVDADRVMLTAPDGSTLVADPPVTGARVPTSLARLASVRAAGAEADEWLTRQIGVPVRLGWLDDPRRRSVSPAHGGEEGDALNLADAGPLLLTTTASLDQLNEWIAEDAVQRDKEPPTRIVMARFRPSIVVDGADAPFVEDHWRIVRIGEVEFRFAEHCDRCVLTTIDPTTRVQGKEPLRTLARYRQWDHKTFFGIRLIPISVGTIRGGDPVHTQ